MDKPLTPLYSGLDTRQNIISEKKGGFAAAKNVDIDGKTARRARGQEISYEHTAGWLGLSEHEVNGLMSLSGVDVAGNYLRFEETGDGIEIVVPMASTGDISTAVYENKSFDFGSNGAALCIKEDGTKMLVLESTSHIVYQYTLSTAWDISTAVYDNKNFDIGTSGVVGIHANSNWNKILISVFNHLVYQYSFSNNDISTAVYDNKSLDTINEANMSWDSVLSHDGTKLYVSAGIPPIIYQYTLSTPGDISTAVYSGKSKNCSGECDHQIRLFFNSDGTRIYQLGVVNSPESIKIYQYTLSTAWDISTAVYDNKNFDPTDKAASPFGIFLDRYGYKLYTIDFTPGVIYQYSLDVSSKSGLAGAIAGKSPYFFKEKNNLVVITGGDDPFFDTGSSIGQTGLYAAKGVYGSCGCASLGRILIANGNTVYWSAAGTLNDWTTAQDAGFNSYFDGEIIGLHPFSSYVLIRTRSSIWIMSGRDPTDFTWEKYSDDESFSKFDLTKLDNKLYLFTNKGLYPIETTGLLYQGTFKNSLGYKIQNLIKDELDPDRLDDVRIVAYENRKQIWMWLPIKNQATLYKVFIISFENVDDSQYPSAWVTREANAITCACKFKGNIYSGTSTGKIYKEDSGNSFDGSAIVSSLKSNPINFGTTKQKKCKELMLFHNSLYANKYNVSVVYNGDLNTEWEENIDLSSYQGLINAVLSDKINLRGYFDSMQFEITTTELGEDFAIYKGEFIDLRVIN